MILAVIASITTVQSAWSIIGSFESSENFFASKSLTIMFAVSSSSSHINFDSYILHQCHSIPPLGTNLGLKVWVFTHFLREKLSLRLSRFLARAIVSKVSKLYCICSKLTSSMLTIVTVDRILVIGILFCFMNLA